MHSIKANRLFTVRLFRPVNTLKCSEYPKTKDIVMMEIAWKPPTLLGAMGATAKHSV